MVSTTTHTGQRLARGKFGEGNVFYFPLDFALCIRPYLRALRPALVILAETEFWPNFLRLARASGAHLVVVNARISDRSYPRYLRFRGLLGTVLEPVELFLAQSDGDAERLRTVGAAAERVEVSGNLKFDVAPPVESPAVTQVGEQLRATARRSSSRAARWRTKRSTFCRRSGWFWGSIRERRWSWRHGTRSALTKWPICWPRNASAMCGVLRPTFLSRIFRVGTAAGHAGRTGGNLSLLKYCICGRFAGATGWAQYSGASVFREGNPDWAIHRELP